MSVNTLDTYCTLRDGLVILHKGVDSGTHPYGVMALAVTYWPLALFGCVASMMAPPEPTCSLSLLCLKRRWVYPGVEWLLMN